MSKPYQCDECKELGHSVSHWLQLQTVLCVHGDGLHFCSYECLTAYANRKLALIKQWDDYDAERDNTVHG